jgi:tripartite-type tricarboxylate transporter receptor subunit TctC
MNKTLLGVVGITLVSCAMNLQAQSEWPTRPVTMIVPFPPGGGTDAFARPLAGLLPKQLGQQILLDNRGGAGGTIGAAVAARAAGDGYTFFIGAVHHAIAPSVYNKLDYNLQQDFIPITSLAHVPQVVVVNPQRVTATTLKEFIAMAQKDPGRTTFGSAGGGTSHHLAGELFQIVTATKMLHVPYKGAGPALIDLIGGQIDSMFDGLGSSSAHIRGGKLKALAVAGPKRAEAFPDIPTTAEAGLPSFTVATWYGIWAPKGTPARINDRLQREVATFLALKEVKDLWFNQGAAAGGESSASFTAFVNAEVEKWAKIAKTSGARAE